MKKSFFLSVLITVVLCTPVAAQMINIFEAATRIDTEGSTLARKLSAHILNSEKDFVFRVKHESWYHLQKTSVSFKYRAKVFTVEYQNDMSSDGSVINNSFLKISSYPKDRPQDEVSFTDYLLNGGWDEYESQTYFFSFENVGKEKDVELQKKFLETLKEALEYFE